MIQATVKRWEHDTINRRKFGPLKSSSSTLSDIFRYHQVSNWVVLAFGEINIQFGMKTKQNRSFVNFILKTLSRHIR